MASVPRCSECAEPLLNEDGTRRPAGTKTCSKVCRQKRARRLKRETHERAVARGSLPPHLAEVSEVVTAGAKDAAHTALVEEMRPHVREAMTAQVLSSIQTMVGLTPRAIELIAEQMESNDEVIAQRAATLMLKYTMGNPSVAPPPTHQSPAGMNVVFNVPRSEPNPPDATAPEVPDAEELRTCGDCGEAKPEGEFVAGSQRCRDCFDSMRGMLTERFGDAYQG